MIRLTNGYTTPRTCCKARSFGRGTWEQPQMRNCCGPWARLRPGSCRLTRPHQLWECTDLSDSPHPVTTPSDPRHRLLRLAASYLLQRPGPSGSELRDRRSAHENLAGMVTCLCFVRSRHSRIGGEASEIRSL